MRWASDNSRGRELAEFLQADCPEPLVLAGELFFELGRCHAAERGQDALNVLRDLALRELAGVTNGKH